MINPIKYLISTYWLLLNTRVQEQPQMQQQQIQPRKWCKFEAFDTISLALTIVMLTVQILLLGLYVYSLKIRKNNNIYMSTYQSFLFRIVTIWFIVIFSKSFINICDYVIFVSDQTQSNNRFQIILAAVQLFLDRMSSFTLHTILIKIPCIWIKNITMKLQNKELTLAQMKRADLIFKVLNIMDKYFAIRMVIILINLAFNIYFSIQPNFGQYAKYLTIITMFEATVAISIYTFGMFTLRIFQDLFSIPKSIKKKIITQYILLTVCCLSRLIFNTVFYFIPWHSEYKPLQNCRQNFPEDNLKSYFYISVVFFMIHIVPVLTIIVVYWPQTKKSHIEEESLINSNTSDINYTGTSPIKVLSNNYLLGSNKKDNRYFQSLSHEARNENIQGLGKSIFK